MSKNLSISDVLFLIAVLAMINFLLMNELGSTLGFNIGRIVLAIWGGWFIVSKTNSSLWFSALVGIIIMIVDHIILKGGFLLIMQVFSQYKFRRITTKYKSGTY